MAAQPPWRYILATLAGAEVGEVWQAADRRVSRPLIGGAGAGTATMRLDLDNPMVPKILGANPASRLELLLKAYRGTELMFVGDLLNAEAAADGSRETFALSAAGPLITRVNTRYIGKSLQWVGGGSVGFDPPMDTTGGVSGGVSTEPGPSRVISGYGDGTPLAQKDLTQIAHNVLSVVNAEFDTGVRSGNIGTSILGYVEKLHWKKAGELLVEQSQALGGYDLAIDPVEPVADAFGTRIATMNTYAVMGSAKPAAIFEYGTGKRNVQSWRQPFDTAGMANYVAHLAPGFPDSTPTGIVPIISATNTATVTRRRREDVVSVDLQPEVMRQMLVAEHVRIRGYPRETIFFVPKSNCDVQYGTHYREGDLVTARAATLNGLVVFDAVFRVYGVEFTVDDMGVETVELALINEGAQI